MIGEIIGLIEESNGSKCLVLIQQMKTKKY